MNEIFIDVGFEQICKHKQNICGDNYIVNRIDSDGRTICVLSDGLGSGIKASVLATLCSSMAAQFARKNADITRVASTIMDTLPICQVRKISYSTFTLISIEANGEVHMIEYDNPSSIITGAKIDTRCITVQNNQREATLVFSSFKPQAEDRIVICSDGVTQAGMGNFDNPLGWGDSNLNCYIRESVERYPDICAQDLARKVSLHAHQLDGYHAKDDITCGVIYFRKPRKTAVFTGPPVDRNRDQSLWQRASDYNGKKIICGGTTAEIIARECQESLELDLSDLNEQVPPRSHLEGFNLVTEGTITLGYLLSIFKRKANGSDNAAGELFNHLINSDIVDFFVGTKINEAHQDPNLPQELELRRNLVKRIKHYLETLYLKKVSIHYI